ncbi:MAG: type II secretion system protein [Bacillota bacterium]|nr:type II secretion system protein [Bacillota bacterium]
MRKMLKSKKGFSLIELLIVVAILAILAAISINLFGGVLKKQKTKSDAGAASYVQTAIQTYINETDDSGLTLVGSDKSFDGVVTYLSSKHTLVPLNGDPQGDYGPYLNSSNIKLSQQDMILYVEVDSGNQTVTATVEKKTTGPHAKGANFLQLN